MSHTASSGNYAAGVAQTRWSLVPTPLETNTHVVLFVQVLAHASCHVGRRTITFRMSRPPLRRVGPINTEPTCHCCEPGNGSIAIVAGFDCPTAEAVDLLISPASLSGSWAHGQTGLHLSRLSTNLPPNPLAQIFSPAIQIARSTKPLAESAVTPRCVLGIGVFFFFLFLQFGTGSFLGWNSSCFLQVCWIGYLFC